MGGIYYMLKTLSKDQVEIDVDLKNKEDVLNCIAAAAKKNALLAGHTQEEIKEKLCMREQLSSTGLDNKVAIPHCSFPNMGGFVVGLVRTKEPIDFGALDGNKSQLFIFIIGSDVQRNRHIKILSSISQALIQKNMYKMLFDAKNEDEVVRIFNSEIDLSEEDLQSDNKSRITVTVQNEAYFDEILHMLSGEVDGSLVVYETESASKYLHKIPLLASFWGVSENYYCRVITIVVRQVSVSSIIRKIKEIVPDIERGCGISLTVTDLSYSIGSLDY
jgi:mannitol/fructose-specific phosphotransferase system IIA component (Ntr-type)